MDDFFGVICGWCRTVLEDWGEPRVVKGADGNPTKDVQKRITTTCPDCAASKPWRKAVSA